MSNANSIDRGIGSHHPAAPSKARRRAPLLAATVLGAGALLAAASPAGAYVVFQDNFDAAPSGSALNSPPSGWSITDGSVDWIDNTNSFGDGGTNLACRGDRGGCVDLDGSTGNAGIMSQTFTLTQGTQYLFTAYLSGNPRGTDYPTSAGAGAPTAA